MNRLIRILLAGFADERDRFRAQMARSLKQCVHGSWTSGDISSVKEQEKCLPALIEYSH